MDNHPFEGKYVEGSAVWNRTSVSQDCWRIGIVTSVDSGYMTGVTVCKPDHRAERFVYNSEYSGEIMPRGVVPNTPTDTVYLVNTKIGQNLYSRLPDAAHFEVYECGTRARTKGNLLGYLILPCTLYEASKWYESPLYKSWQVGPSVYELLSFLGSKLPEIISTYHQLEQAHHK